VSDEREAEKGRRLEAEVAEALAAGGYAARRNVVRTGRSGARHEIDVYAEKGDGLTTFSLVVECKAWDRPIDKQVLAKAAFVGADVGADKTIVVALSGATDGAGLSASELGVEVWGPDELERRLGRARLAGLGAARSGATALGFAVTVAPERAARLAERRRGKGVLGLGAEEVVWFDLLWLPCLLLTLGCTREQGRLHRRARHSSVYNLYEVLGGRLVASYADDPCPGEVVVGANRLPARVRPAALRREIETTFDHWRAVPREAARRRWDLAAEELGLPLPADALTVDDAVACHLPVYAAVLRQGAARRVVAIDATTGEVDDRLSAALTAALGSLADALTDLATP
jgi:hypothetical protein